MVSAWPEFRLASKEQSRDEALGGGCGAEGEVGLRMSAERPHASEPTARENSGTCRSAVAQLLADLPDSFVSSGAHLERVVAALDLD